MRDHLLDRIYGEYQAYKASILSLTNAEIFAKCYEIDIMTNLYDILAEHTEKLPDDTIRALLDRPNILSEIYERWMKKDDTNYAELENHVSDEVGNIVSEENSGLGKGAA